MRKLLTVVLLAAVAGRWAVAAEPASQEVRHWSWQPRSRPDVPRFSDPADQRWVRNAVDAFLLARLKKEGLRPTPPADRRVLIRRLYFDLTGLPPTPPQLEAASRDTSPDWFEKLVDQLLASPHYGERWATHWLDVVRFAETEGFEYDRTIPGAWRYRDYVIGSLNADKPYDRFVREQLAGDEVDADSRDCQVAAGFHRLGPVRRNAGNQKVAFSRNEVLTEMVDIVGAVFLGLTVGCARCHDHKFDEITQADYYRLQAFLAATHEHDIVLADAATQADWKARTDQVLAEIKKLEQEITRVEGPAREQLRAKLAEVRRRLPPPLPAISSVHHVEAERTPIHLLKRGDPDRKGELLGMRVLPSLLTAPASELPPQTPKPRTLLASWINDPANPLPARVLVNRVWQHHFGRGLVDTPNDFGVNGSLPSHPELLDWLANEFLASGRRLKPLHRLLVTSSAYRQASRSPDSQGLEKDPDNRLLWRFNRRRLSAEEVRDAMLAVAGQLNLKRGGPSAVSPVEPDLVNLLYDPTQWTMSKDPEEHNRRTIYLIAKRNLRLPFTQVFDQPDLQTSCARREQSTHAPQALALLNGETANRLAAALAQRLRLEAGAEPARQVEMAFRLSAGRPPTEKEKHFSLDFLATQSLKEFALAMYNLNAFLYVD